MIRQLTVKDYLIFGSATLKFDEGFNVLSGETGAGKSLIVDALNLLVGGRVDWSSVHKKAYLEMVLEGDEKLEEELNELGIPYEGVVVVRRTFNPTSRRSYTLINDMHVSASVLRKLFEGRIFIGSQFSHTEIDDPKFQTDVLDRFASVDFGNYSEIYSQYELKAAKLRKLESRLSELKKKEDYLRFQVEEFKKMDLKEGEEEELLRRREELESIVKTRQWASNFNDAYPTIREMLVSLIKDAPSSFRLNLEGIIETLDDIALSLPAEDEDISEEFDRINARLYEIGRLKTRFKTDFEGLLSLARSIEEELESIAKLEEEVRNLKMEMEGLRLELSKLGDYISEQRKEKIEDFERYIEDSLKDLGFKYVNVKVELTPVEIYEKGNTAVKILVSTIPDLPPGPISKLSGGELSRMALVLFSSGATKFRTLVLDEIDVGVSPSVADRIGKLLRKLSKSVQIISITHQPFTAVHAQKHFVVERSSPSTAYVKEVVGEERRRELERMHSHLSLDPL